MGRLQVALAIVVNATTGGNQRVAPDDVPGACSQPGRRLQRVRPLTILAKVPGDYRVRPSEFVFAPSKAPSAEFSDSLEWPSRTDSDGFGPVAELADVADSKSALFGRKQV